MSMTGDGWGLRHFFETPVVVLPEPPDEPVLLTVRVDLKWAKPPVWRRLTVPGDIDLETFHWVLQIAMGWEDMHLHKFTIGTKAYDRDTAAFLTTFEAEEGEEGTAEWEARLDQVLRQPRDVLTYLYDFGDDWQHTIRLEKVEPAGQSAPSGPRCIKGRGACPPEDIGGIGRYLWMADWARSGYSSDYLAEYGGDADELLEWLGPGWHPDAFDVDEVNRALAKLEIASD